MERKHTPLPWGWHFNGTGGQWRLINLTTGVGLQIGGPPDVDNSADMKFIVRACNSYYDLIEALEKCAGALRAGQNSMSPRVAFTGDWSHLGTLSVSEILDEANTALSLAKGEAS